MENGKIFIFVIFIFVVCFFYGCKDQGISIHHENTLDKIKSDIKKENDSKTVVKKSSGIIIYKDNTTTNNTSKNVNFGPGDLDFGNIIKVK